tara:strand:+ start:11 stop:445 length:435 start_codon:yes stop_codon:yes gene_type:complete
LCDKVVYSDEDLLIVNSRIYRSNIIEPLAIASSIILALSLERALIADTPIMTKKYVISLTLIVSVLNLNIAKIAKSPNAKPKSNFTLLNKKQSKNVISPAELYVKKNSFNDFLLLLLNFRYINLEMKKTTKIFSNRIVIRSVKS